MCFLKCAGLVVSPSRSPTSAANSQTSLAYSPASPSYSLKASQSYNSTDASTRHSSYNELILIHNDPVSDADYETIISLMSPSLRPTSERGLDTPMNVTGPWSTGLNASSSYDNILSPSSYNMTY
ncbi:Hypothetical protein CINCED_3A016003 [Cinara cedri]|uniref:Uncharacterized protein n=1 Tax=Cinara cedri TaxID=506608 RepID=A0A5E4NKR6_9HEMI|nr:Hypothetical protein CINCED_3A016003 [Cinara cedri]